MSNLYTTEEKQKIQDEISDFWNLVGYERIQKGQTYGILGDTEQHKDIYNLVINTIPNLLDSDLISICTFCNTVVEYIYINTLLEKSKNDDIQLYLKFLQTRNQVESKISSWVKSYGLSHATKNKIALIFDSEVEQC